jgi:hypothetical protein
MYAPPRDSKIPTPGSRRPSQPSKASEKIPYEKYRKILQRIRKFDKVGNAPSQNTLATVVDLAEVINLAGFDAKRDTQIVSTGYTAKVKDGVVWPVADEQKLTPQMLKGMGFKEVEWDGR